MRGTPGLKVDALDTDGGKRELFRTESRDGAPLQLTMDLDLQTEAESLLADVGPASALVALRPSTGEILAAANGPGNGGINLATFGQFAPGSTFKSARSLALLRAGLTPDSRVPCTASIVVDGKTFTNYNDYPSGALGEIPLRTAVANSCNTAFISQYSKSAAPTCSTPASRSASGSTTTSASRRTSAASSPRPPRPSRPHS